MRRLTAVVVLLMLGTFAASAQTETPTPTETATPTPTETPAPYVYATVPPSDGTPPGQMTRFDYVTTAGDVHIANLLTIDVISSWGQFLFTVVFLSGLARRRK